MSKTWISEYGKIAPWALSLVLLYKTVQALNMTFHVWNLNLQTWIPTSMELGTFRVEFQIPCMFLDPTYMECGKLYVKAQSPSM